MGAKSSALVFANGSAADVLAGRPTHDPRRAAEVVARLFPGRGLAPAVEAEALDLYPYEEEVVVACYPGVTIVAAQELASIDPDDLEARFVRALRAETVLFHAMHSVADWFAFRVWRGGRLVRSLSVAPDSEENEDRGERLPFEVPYWEGAHPVDDEDTAEEDRYPLPFHPLELGEATLLEFLGFQIEGDPGDWRVEPEELLSTRFTAEADATPASSGTPSVPVRRTRRPRPTKRRWWWPFGGTSY
jgi:hypothetical protein